MSSLGEKLYQCRVRKGLSQTQVANLLGISTSSMSGYEKNVRKPTNKKLARFAELYEVPISWLLGIQESSHYSTSDKELHSFIKDPELERWYRELPTSNEEDLRKLKKIWETIKNEDTSV
ncbi:helix-turn-helix domain-containing protein [Domibacillus indicus]|uniref:helix-turn-helix domain-containing protein n=1 Tax=Domibacillus indicus TaxID=1437523 RepID=UPI00203D1A2D|nr:helix-turn-helix transcriptional regulator [Domibacillus indicus]MCM3791277.1 helix-turn-helix domain-containing protein [Domibacillus indicus]